MGLKYLLARHFYEKALAMNFCSNKEHVSDYLWCLYKLGKYRSVAQANVSCDDIRGCFAKAVSYAACGLREQAIKEVELFMTLSGASSQMHELSKALAPFLPDLALKIIESQKIKNVALYAGLLIRNGFLDEAKALTLNLTNDENRNLSPELYLIQSNISDLCFNDRLFYLNQFLAAYGISRVLPLNSMKPLSTLNLTSDQASRSFMDGPLVTVLMTTFNSEKRVGSAISSILTQTYQNIELIIIDDASTDGTLTIIEEWALHDQRIRVVKMEINGGTYLAKNIGLQYALGVFVTCHDSDDWAHPQKIQMQVERLLKQPNLIASISCLVRLRDDGQYVARAVSPLMRINPSSLMFRRMEVLQKMGSWDCVRTGADTEFMVRMRLVFGRKRICRLRQPLTLAAQHSDSLTNAVETGFNNEGVSAHRLSYWEAWSDWHIACLKQKMLPKLGSNLADIAEEKRPFELPRQLEISSNDIFRYMKSATLGRGFLKI